MQARWRLVAGRSLAQVELCVKAGWQAPAPWSDVKASTWLTSADSTHLPLEESDIFQQLEVVR